ncbi:MAG: MOSC domain-containing protein, partial [Candidatus Competibacteraceae bacterium]|nr:MOSC domain-containing protein [Candidatus Competibacteraceae bacterium]
QFNNLTIPSSTMSGIHKRTVVGQVVVNKRGLAGDEQADLTVHGGLAKAVYAYPAEHYAFWQAQRKQLGGSPDLPYGSLGENLTLSGVLENAMFVGDELHFPNCVLRVTQPREPCFKLNAFLGDRQAAKKMVQMGFCGFYLAVDEVGTIAAGQTFTVKPSIRQVSISDFFRVATRRDR